MIRPATVEDCRVIAELGEAFFTEAGWGDVAEYSVDDCRRSLEFMVGNDNGILLVADRGEIVGMAGGLISPLYFNLSHKTGQELFWWIKPGERNGIGADLLEAMEYQAMAKGCSSWAMLSLARVNPEAMDRLYARRGYRRSETTYIKRF